MKKTEDYNIHDLRVINGLSLDDVASALELTRQQYVKKENGVAKFWADELIRLETIFDCDYEKIKTAYLNSKKSKTKGSKKNGRKKKLLFA